MKIYVGKVVLPFIGYDGTNKAMGLQEYIDYCNKTKTVYCANEDGICAKVQMLNPFINTNDGILCNVDFPTNDNPYGSTVVALYDERYGHFAIGSGDISNGYTLDESNQIKMMRKSDDPESVSSALVDIRGNKGIVNIQTTSNKSDGSKINVSALNKDKKGEINLTADILNTISETGTVTVFNLLEFIIKDLSVKEKFASIKYELQKGFTFTDEFDNIISQTEAELILKHAKKVNVGSGNQPAVLGNTLNTQLTNLMTKLDNWFSNLILPVSGASAGPPNNLIQIKADITAIKNDLKNILSSYLNIQ